MLRSLNESFGGKRICGIWRMGARASEIPTTGDYPALGLNDIDPSDPVGTEYSVQIKSLSAGTMDVDEYTAFTFTPPSPSYTGTITGTQTVSKTSAAPYDETFSFAYAAAGTSVSSDLTASYSVGAWVSSDQTASYNVLAFVSADLGATYSVNTSLTPVSSDLTASYAVSSYVSADLVASYVISAWVSSDLTAAYNVAVGGSLVSADLVGSYGVSAYVSADLHGTYSVLSDAVILIPNTNQFYKGKARTRIYTRNMNFTPKRYTENEVFTVDYADDLADGETILSAAWSISTVDGTDPAAASMISGSAQITGSIVCQRITGGVPGVRYAPICTAQTSMGQKLVLPEYGMGQLEVTL